MWCCSNQINSSTEIKKQCTNKQDVPKFNEVVKIIFNNNQVIQSLHRLSILSVLTFSCEKMRIRWDFPRIQRKGKCVYFSIVWVIKISDFNCFPQTPNSSYRHFMWVRVSPECAMCLILSWTAHFSTSMSILKSSSSCCLLITSYG